MANKVTLNIKIDIELQPSRGIGEGLPTVNFGVSNIGSQSSASRVHVDVPSAKDDLYETKNCTVSDVVELAPLTKLLVQGLDDKVTQEELRFLFSKKGDVIDSSIFEKNFFIESRCGYVEYSNPEDAEKAKEDLNFTLLNEKPILIAYLTEDSSTLKSIWVKNLDKSVDQKTFYDIFSTFGKVILSKVMTDSLGNSKGYGLVDYTTDEAVRKAINHLQGKSIFGKKIVVRPVLEVWEETQKTMERLDTKKAMTSYYEESRKAREELDRKQALLASYKDVLKRLVEDSKLLKL